MLRSAILALALLAAAPVVADAQYRRPVFVYDNGCDYTVEVKNSGKPFMTVGGMQYGVRVIEGEIGVMSFGYSDRLPEYAGPNPFSRDQSNVAIHGTVTVLGGRCRVSLEALQTDSLVRRYRAYGDDAERSVRGYRRAATAFFVGAVAITAGTLLHMESQTKDGGQAEALPLVLGLTVAGVTAWAGGQMLDFAWEPRARRDKYRNLERWILQESR